MESGNHKVLGDFIHIYEADVQWQSIWYDQKMRRNSITIDYTNEINIKIIVG